MSKFPGSQERTPANCLLIGIGHFRDESLLWDTSLAVNQQLNQDVELHLKQHQGMNLDWPIPACMYFCQAPNRQCQTLCKYSAENLVLAYVPCDIPRVISCEWTCWIMGWLVLACHQHLPLVISLDRALHLELHCPSTKYRHTDYSQNCCL